MVKRKSLLLIITVAQRANGSCIMTPSSISIASLDLEREGYQRRCFRAGCETLRAPRAANRDGGKTESASKGGL